ncbi:lipopolysaccharide biosynthesis protein [Rheinheimera muenzenbergensis]|uniref:Lipopolysaccharide biosynthesis protein n=1 Tax=Rheinheimera muenzenbergensis TaxID=1193628 RepID=A0ABU8CAQ1_9GAMM
MSNATPGLGKKIAIGAAWSVLTRLSIKGLGFISTIILARLLFPADFGIMAACMAMVAFFEIFTSFSFDINIIQKDNVTDDTLNSAWTCKLLSGLLLAILLFIASPWISAFFNDPRLTLVVQAVAFIPLIKSAENIGFVLYRKNLDLKKEFNLEVIAKLLSFTVTLAAAFYWQNYWALVIGMFSNAIARVLLSYAMHSYRPAFGLSQAAELFRFSKWLLLNNLLIFLNHKVTDLIIGNRANTTELGYYSVSYEISNLPTTELVFPLSRAIFPGYSLVKSDINALRDMFLKITAVVLFFAAPICFGFYAVAHEAVALFLGDKWLNIVPMVSILAFYGLSRCAVQNMGNVFVALGKPHISTYISLSRLIVIVPLLLYAVSHYGALGAAGTVLAVSLITLPISFWTCSLLLKFTLRQVVMLFAFPIIAAVIMTLAIKLLGYVLQQQQVHSVAVLLLAKVATGVFCYVAMAALYLGYITKNEFWLQLLHTLKARIIARRSPKDFQG